MSLKDKYRRALERIFREEGEVLKPETVVDRARNPDNELNDYFDWDDRRVAERQRREEARVLIRSYMTIQITEYNLKIDVRELVHDPDLLAKTGGGYIEAVTIKNDPSKARRVVLERARQIAAQINNTLNLCHLWKLDDAIDLLGDALRPMAELVELYEDAGVKATPPPPPPPRGRRRRRPGSPPGSGPSPRP